MVTGTDAARIHQHMIPLIGTGRVKRNTGPVVTVDHERSADVDGEPAQRIAAIANSPTRRPVVRRCAEPGPPSGSTQTESRPVIRGLRRRLLKAAPWSLGQGLGLTPLGVEPPGLSDDIDEH
mgnify:CR=1 FL=1